MDGKQIAVDTDERETDSQEQEEDNGGIVKSWDDGSYQIEFEEDVDEPEENDVGCCRTVEEVQGGVYCFGGKMMLHERKKGEKRAQKDERYGEFLKFISYEAEVIGGSL